MKTKMSMWFFGFGGVVPDYEKGEKWMVVLGMVMSLVGLGFAIYGVCESFVGHVGRAEYFIVALAMGFGGGLVSFGQAVKCFARELKKRRQDTA